jgi:hypothetical protein
MVFLSHSRRMPWNCHRVSHYCFLPHSGQLIFHLGIQFTLI